MKNIKQTAQNIFDLADIKIDGNRPWDIQVHDDRFYQRVLAGGSLGLGESYMDGWWDCEKLDEFFYRVLMAKLDKKITGIKKVEILSFLLRAKFKNMQSKGKNSEKGVEHYNVGNDLYEKMLGKSMAYTCGYWKGLKDSPENLDKAQFAKLDLICKKLHLKPGMHILELGCGFGGFAKFAAENYGVKVVGSNISVEQVKFAKEHCKRLPVEIRLQDYRNIKGTIDNPNEKFDRIVTIGMVEHVGPKNYKKFFEIVSNNLKKRGLFLYHGIGNNYSKSRTDTWIDKYIFPNAVLPSPKYITQASEGILVMEDWHNFGAYYDKTLMAWYNNFMKNWSEIKKIKDDKGNLKYDNRFKRMWIFYLLCCAGNFRSRTYNQLWQIVFSKNGVEGGYESVR